MVRLLRWHLVLSEGCGMRRILNFVVFSVYKFVAIVGPVKKLCFVGFCRRFVGWVVFLLWGVNGE